MNLGLKYFLILYNSIFPFIWIVANEYPPDICFLVADLKLTVDQEIKICEIQQGTLSTFRGDYFSYGDKGNIAPHFCAFLSHYQKPVWINPIYVVDREIKNLAKEHRWKTFNQLSQLLAEPQFCSYASQNSVPHNIEECKGFIFSGLNIFKDLKTFRQQFPGILVLDASTNDYWIDKYKMSLIFKNHPQLNRYKPRWNAYPKIYSDELASEIMEDLECERFVIKPRRAFRGCGIIMVEKNDLDAVLHSILHRNAALRKNKDKDHSYWYYDSSKSFIVEEFIASEPVVVEHLNNQFYEPTIRIAFFLIYEKKSIQIEFCGAFYRFPPKPLSDDKATLNEKYKDFSTLPFYGKIDPAVYEKVKEELNICLPIFYEELLKNQFCSYRK